MGWQNAFHCEIDDFCNTILNYWFKDAKSYTDVTTTDFREWRGKINVLTGGFPCQPFSVAGQRKGADDNRYLWPHMLRAIHEIRPDWVIGENVAGILTMVQPGQETEVGSQSTLFGESEPVFKRRQQYVVETICRDLEREGYSVQPVLIPACAVELPTAGTGYGLLPTVTAQDYKRRGPNSRQQGLPEMIHEILLPTPLATEIHHPERVHKWKQAYAPSLYSQLNGEKKPNGSSDFLDFYGMLLPTPVASDAGVGAVMGKTTRS